MSTTNLSHQTDLAVKALESAAEQTQTASDQLQDLLTASALYPTSATSATPVPAPVERTSSQFFITIPSLIVSLDDLRTHFSSLSRQLQSQKTYQQQYWAPHMGIDRRSDADQSSSAAGPSEWFAQPPPIFASGRQILNIEPYPSSESSAFSRSTSTSYDADLEHSAAGGVDKPAKRSEGRGSHRGVRSSSHRFQPYSNTDRSDDSYSPPPSTAPRAELTAAPRRFIFSPGTFHLEEHYKYRDGHWWCRNADCVAKKSKYDELDAMMRAEGGEPPNRRTFGIYKAGLRGSSSITKRAKEHVEKEHGGRTSNEPVEKDHERSPTMVAVKDEEAPGNDWDAQGQMSDEMRGEVAEILAAWWSESPSP